MGRKVDGEGITRYDRVVGVASMAQLGARFEPSHRVGDFVLRRWLAQGGMAELYLATPAEPARARELVVLKRVLPQFTRSESFARMFSREARLASMLRHPNIVEVHEGGGHGPDCFFTMEYVHGVDLSLLLDALRDRSGAMPLAHALTIAVSMCAGLHHAHEAHDPQGRPLQIVHRDVSPSNVLISFDGQVKVTDFGVATALAMTRLTEEGTRKGKLAYMSPEQATGETVDRRADVFAIAAVLYELTTMHRLFGGDNDLAIMYNILNRPRPSPRQYSPGYPAALEQIVMRAVSHDASERFSSALQLQQALESFAASVGLTLSTAALGQFVRSTVPMPVHPAEDPELWTTSIRPRSASHHIITSVEGHSAPGSGPSGAPSYPTGPIPGISMTGPTPGFGVPASAAHSGRGPVAVGPSGPWPASPPRSSSMLRWLSLVLAGVAVVVVVAVAVVALSTQEPETPEPSAPASEAASAPAAPTPLPALLPTPTPTPIAEPTPPDPPATEPAITPPESAPSTTTPSPRRSKKKKRKTRTDSGSTDPSKKPAPTDTLLPIRE